MKSINQIFKNNKHLMDEPEVMELVEYCRDMESEIIEYKQTKKYSFEDKLTTLVREIYSNLREMERMEVEHERFGFDKPNHEEAIKGLTKYLIQFSMDNKFRL
jgi:ABC-type microcin C transport system permease subunit YejB